MRNKPSRNSVALSHPVYISLVFIDAMLLLTIQHLQRSLRWKKCQENNAWGELWCTNTGSEEHYISFPLQVVTGKASSSHRYSSKTGDDPGQDIGFKGRRILYTDIYLAWGSVSFLVQWFNIRSGVSRSRYKCESSLYSSSSLSLIFIFSHLLVLSVPYLITHRSDLLLFLIYYYFHTSTYIIICCLLVS